MTNEERKIYNYLRSELGERKIPTHIPYKTICKWTGLTRKQATNRIQKLIKYNLLEQWSNVYKIGNRYNRMNYYRIKI